MTRSVRQQCYLVPIMIKEIDAFAVVLLGVESARYREVSGSII